MAMLEPRVMTRLDDRGFVPGYRSASMVGSKLGERVDNEEPRIEFDSEESLPWRKEFGKDVSRRKLVESAIG